MSEIGSSSANHEVGTDPWAGYFPGPESIPCYLTAAHAAQYRVIVDVLLAAQDTSLLGLNFDEVRTLVGDRLAATTGADVAAELLTEASFPLDNRLNQLHTWGVVDRWQDAVSSGEDFLRRRDRFQLTVLAAKFHDFWSTLQRETDDDSGDFTLAPKSIFERLVAFRDAVRGQDFPAAAAEFQQVVSLHTGMTKASRSWQRNLAHAAAGGPNKAKQQLQWNTFNSYTSMWGEQVDIYTEKIFALLTDLGPTLTQELWLASVRSGLGPKASPEQIQSGAQRFHTTWDSLATWFDPEEGQAKRLRRQLRNLIAPWARNARLLLEVGQVASRRTELLALARHIEQAADDRSAWQLWDTATGLFSARHLLIPAPSGADHTLSWLQADPAAIEVRYREHGRHAVVARKVKRPDYSPGRKQTRQAERSRRQAQVEAQLSLAQRSGTLLSDWEPLSEKEFQFFQELLSVAKLGHRQSVRTALTGDGQWRVTFSATQLQSTLAIIENPCGQLALRNVNFTLELA